MAAPKGNKYAVGSKNNGSPMKYKPEYCKSVKEHLAEGYTLTSWAGTIGICRSTAYNWAEKYEVFLDAINVGRAKGQLVWEMRLSLQAVNGSGNTAAIIFGMKNLYRDDWADKIINELTGRDGAPIETTTTINASKLSKGALEELLAAKDECINE